MRSDPRVVDLQSLIVATARLTFVQARLLQAVNSVCLVVLPNLCCARSDRASLKSESRKLHHGHSSRLLHRC